jgi:integrase
MAKAPITKRTVDAAKPGATEYVVWDDGGKETVKGFGLKVTPAGAKVYIYQYRLSRPGEAAQTSPKKHTLGRHGDLTPDQARHRARQLAVMVSSGIDPRQAKMDAMAAKDAAERDVAERERLDSKLAFDKVAMVWLDHYENEKGRRPSSVRMAKLIVNRYLVPSLASKPMPHIGRVDIQPILDGIPVLRRGIRRAVFAYASVLFGWALKRGDISDNPLRAMQKPEAPSSRKRVLSDDELAAVWRASETLGDPFGAFFRLLILTGQRRSEVSDIAWSELDRTSGTWTIPEGRAKNGVAHIVPLSTAAVAELDRLAHAVQVKALIANIDAKRWPRDKYVLTTTGRTPISGITKAKAALDKAVDEVMRDNVNQKPIEAWRIHDLRRTLATGFQRLGVRFEVTEATLNHVSGAKGGVAGIYQRHDWKEEKRAALQAWDQHVEALIHLTDHVNVVPLSLGNNWA